MGYSLYWKLSITKDSTPIKRLNTMANMNSIDYQSRLASWQRSIARRTEAYLEDAVSTATADSMVLRSQPKRPFPKFHRTEVGVGRVLGQGAFSEVRLINRIKLRDNYTSYNYDEEKSRQLLQVQILESSSRRGFVIKYLRKDLANDRKKFYHAATDLLLEAKFLARFDHPNIIQIHGWAIGEEASYGLGLNEGYFMILDKVDETLSQRLDRWSDDPSFKSHPQDQFFLHGRERLRYALQVASALDYMHDQRVVNRDLKPDNLGIRSDTIQLFDFGLCRELPQGGACDDDDDEFYMTRVGTRRWMSPEVFMGEPYGLKADVSCICMLRLTIALAQPSNATRF